MRMLQLRRRLDLTEEPLAAEFALEGVAAAQGRLKLVAQVG
jgi:hypothetical protein